jgi:hypothetical protein
VDPGAADAMADAIEATLSRLRADPGSLRGAARAQARRLFDPAHVCAQISAALLEISARGARA